MSITNDLNISKVDRKKHRKLSELLSIPIPIYYLVNGSFSFI